MPDPSTDRPAPAPAAPKRAATFTTTTSTHPPDPTSHLRSRGPRRQTSTQSLSSSHSRSPAPPAPHRRASTFSLSSIDEISQTLAEDLINPSFTRRRNGPEGDSEEREEEVTNWHSTPLLFALLPAVGGVLFKEGAAVVTDLLILGLAGIFLNWSVRLPWDWYYAAQVVVREAQRGGLEGWDEDVIVEEDGGDDEAEGEKGGKTGEAKEEDAGGNDRMAAITERREEALAGLRTQESFALISTFLFPGLAAYLLHVLRGQLSPSSTGLVSDYNLSIFLLVAEIRPCRQLIRLIKRRTLHLQRAATFTDAADLSGVAQSTVKNLTARLNELETQLQEQQTSISVHGHADNTAIQNSHFDELSVEMKKRYESRIDALERAVRRYEKRTTTLAMVTEQRLKAIDTRLSDTLSLAAVAAQESHRRSAFGRMVDGLLAMVMLPIRMFGMVLMAPVKVLEEAYARVKLFLFGSKPSGKARKRAAEPGRNEQVRGAAVVRGKWDGPVR